MILSIKLVSISKIGGMKALSLKTNENALSK